MKLRHIGKKGDLSLSINAIVILILAITMLGLGLAFIRNQFGGATGKLQDVLNQIDANQKADLEKSADRVTMTTDSYTIKRGDTKNIYFAVRNNLGTASVTFALKSNILCSDFVAVTSTTPPNPLDVQFATFDTRAVDGGTSTVLPLAITVLSKAIPTTYSCSITIPCAANSGCTGTYYKKDFYITVTP